MNLTLQMMYFSFKLLNRLKVVAHGEANALTDMDDHLQITHKSKRLSAAARLYARTIMRVLAGESLSTAAGESGGDLGLDLVAIIKARLHDTDVANGELQWGA